MELSSVDSKGGLRLSVSNLIVSTDSIRFSIIRGWDNERDEMDFAQQVNRLRWLPYMVAIAILLIGFAASPRPAHAACSLTSTTSLSSKLGGDEINYGTTLDGVSATLDDYDPNPVFEESWFFVEISRSNGFEYLRVGWAEWDQYASSPRVIVEMSDANDREWWVYRGSLNGWSSNLGLHWSGAVEPPFNKQYEVFEFNNEWWASYDFGTTLKIPTEWSQTHAGVFGMVASYATGDKGDQAPGDPSNKVESQDTKKNINGVWSNTSLGAPWTYEEGPFDVEDNVGSGDGVRVHDTRC